MRDPLKLREHILYKLPILGEYDVLWVAFSKILQLTTHNCLVDSKILSSIASIEYPTN